MATKRMFAPPDLPNMVFWYQADALLGLADGATIETWSDISGAGRHLTHDTASQRPIYKPGILSGRPVARFARANAQRLYATGAVAQPITVFVVWKSTNTGASPAGRGCVLEGRDTDYSSILYAQQDTTQQIVCSAGNYSRVVPFTNFIISTAIYNGASSLVRENGAQRSTGTASYGLANGVTVGGRYGQSYWLDGDVAEIIGYNSVLGMSDRIKVENYLAIKYGFTLIPSYDANHVAMLLFDETSGATAFDSVNFANNGTATGTTIIDGWKGKARRLNGGTDKVQHGARVTPLGAKSIRFRYRRNGEPPEQQFVYANATYVSSEHGDRISSVGSGLLTWISCRASGNSSVWRWNFSTSNTTLNNNAWWDLMFTWTGATDANAVKIYVKALEGVNAGKWVDSSGNPSAIMVPNAQGTATHTEGTTQTANLVIGQAPAGGYNFAGDIDQVEISNTARTDMQDYAA